MRKLKFLVPAITAITLAALSGLPLAALQQPGQPAPNLPQPAPPDTQSTPPSQQTTPSQPGAAVPVPSTANSSEVNNVDLRPVSAELVSKLDTKNAKNGDPIVVKTTEKATIGDGVVIPKGSKITGHITDVQAHDGTNPNAKVAIQFDQAELKGGQTLAIKSVLQAVEPAAGSDVAPSSALSVGGATSAPVPSGGGAGTGSSGGAVAPGGSPSGSSQAPIQSPGVGAPASPSAAPSGYPAAGTVVAHQGNIEIKTTAIPGVLIASNASGQPFSNASGALLGARQNVHLDNGTRITLAIANVNATPTR